MVYIKIYFEGPLYWYVQAVDCIGNLLIFSDVNSIMWVFIKSLFVFELSLFVDYETVSGVLLLEWVLVVFGAKYEVEVYKNGDMSFLVVNWVVLR